MVSAERTDASPFADFAALPPVVHRPHPGRRRWALLAAVALFTTTLHGYAFSLLTGLEIVLLVEEVFADANLENDEIGNDPDLAINYNIVRIEKVSEPVPVTVPPPPGFGVAGIRGHRDDPVEQGGLTDELLRFVGEVHGWEQKP